MKVYKEFRFHTYCTIWRRIFSSKERDWGWASL